MADDWKEKYLQSLDDQDTLQAKFEKQQELLRQAVVRLSLAAEGQDIELDDQLGKLRASLRKGYDRPAEVYLIQLDDQLHAFEHRRKHFNQSIEVHLQELTQQLQELASDKEVLKPLRKFQRQLNSRSQQVSNYPEMLQELCQLQKQSLSDEGGEEGKGSAEAQAEKGGLLDKWFGRTKNTDHSAEELVADVEPIEQETSEPKPVRETSNEAVDDSLQAEAAIEGQYQSSGDIDDNVHEPAYSHISDRIERILVDLLDSVDPEECVLQKVEKTRKRIDRGLNWFELVPALEDIRDLVMQAYLAADRDFSSYLETINAELAEIYTLLDVDIKQQVALNTAAKELQAEVGDQLVLLEGSMHNATELDQLKLELAGQVGAIRASLEGFKGVQAEADLEADLQKLLEKVACLEGDAKKHRVELEELRQKSLCDNLTQLPNREAWAERSFHEYQRWQRYQRSLVLAVIDIDFFKQVNDNFGHQAGDRVLKVIGQAISKRLRDVDFFARYGGEEFGVLLPETELASALQLLNTIREAIGAASFHFKEKPLTITVSIGVAVFKGEDDVDAVFARADKALYQAKEQGRNRCIAIE